jgi:F-type H+-transporting ATPase subunit b
MATMTMTVTSEQRRVASIGAMVLAAALAGFAPADAHQGGAAHAPSAQAPATPATTPTHDTPAPADTHTPPPADHAAADHAPAPAGDHGAAASHDAAAGHGEPHGESLWVTLARFANFAILVGVIYWLARKPLADHLAARGAQIRKDLVDAAELRTTATARLKDIEAKLAALPGELDQLRKRGAEELESERIRMREAATAERDRLVEQTRREITSQSRAARGQLRAYAATLAVDVAESRLRATLTAAEQASLVDEYAAQMRNVQ